MRRGSWDPRIGHRRLLLPRKTAVPSLLPLLWRRRDRGVKPRVPNPTHELLPLTPHTDAVMSTRVCILTPAAPSSPLSPRPGPPGPDAAPPLSTHSWVAIYRCTPTSQLCTHSDGPQGSPCSPALPAVRPHPPRVPNTPGLLTRCSVPGVPGPQTSRGTPSCHPGLVGRVRPKPAAVPAEAPLSPAPLTKLPRVVIVFVVPAPPTDGV